MGNIKQINIKNRTYYFHVELINLEDVDSSQLEKDKKSYENFNIYYIEYITIKSFGDYESISGVNPLYLIITEVYGYIEENSGNKYLNIALKNSNNDVLIKYTKIWNEIKYHIQIINADKFVNMVRAI